MPATLKDIADAVGISITTVSKVLGGKEIRVSDAKRQEILEAARRLKYVPTIAGVNLRKGCTDTVAVIMGDLLYPYYAKLLKELSRLIYSHGKSVIVCDIDNNYTMEERHYQRLLTGYVDGAIIVPAPGTLTSDRIRASTELWDRVDIPILVVYGDGGQVFPGRSTLGTDIFRSGYIAARHLVELGHRRIAYVTATAADAKELDLAYAGVQTALEEAGILCDPKLTQWGYTRYMGGREAYHRLRETDATAVICSNDMLAIGFSGAVMEEGKKVPGDWSVVGMDNIMATEQNTPKITTVNQDVQEIADKAVEQFFADMEGRKEGRKPALQHITFQPRLVIRESTSQVKR